MILLDAKLLLRAFSPRMVSKALNTLDKATAIVISACWLAALVTLILAVFAVRGAVSSKTEALAALASEPVLPVVSTQPISAPEIQSVIERLSRQFPDIKIDLKPGEGQALLVKSDDGAKFHQWITALSYIDTMAPEYRWTLYDFCVGVNACSSGQGLMSAVLLGQKIVLSPPKR
jgi:hypothetical protein